MIPLCNKFVIFAAQKYFSTFPGEDNRPLLPLPVGYVIA